MPRVPPRLTRNARRLRSEATPAERILWRLLSRARPRFTRQLRVGPYILDLACREARLAVELDGNQHIAASAYDAARTRFLTGLGWQVLRFWNGDVLENGDGVGEAILASVAGRCGRPVAFVTARRRGGPVFEQRTGKRGALPSLGTGRGQGVGDVDGGRRPSGYAPTPGPSLRAGRGEAGGA